MKVRWRVFASLVGAAGAFAVAARALELPSRAFWSERPAWAFAGALAVAIGTLNGLAETVRNSRRDRSEGNELLLQQPLGALFVSLLDELGAHHYKDLGVHCFLIRRRPPLFRRELVRMAAFGLRTRPQAWVRWTKGKGLIGECWRSQEDVVANLSEEWKNFRQLTEEEWNRLPTEQRYGLSHDEYRRTRDYEVIVATPIHQNGRFIGCISVDSTSPNYDALWSDRVRELLQNAAQAVAWLGKLS